MSELLFTAILIYAALYDHKYHRIPDMICLGMLLLTLITWLSDPGRWQNLEMSIFVGHMAGALILSGMMVCIDLLRPQAFGGGDIKLAAAAGLYLGMRKVLAAGMISIMTAGISCMVMLIMGRITLKTKVAFGPFLATGLIVSLFAGEAICRFSGF